MAAMGVSSLDSMMKDFGFSSWGKRVELPSATFRYKIADGNVLIDGLSFRFTAENWILPNREAYRINQSVGTIWRLYDQIETNKNFSVKHRKRINDFMDELNDFITGNHTELTASFIFGSRPVMRYGELKFEWMYFTAIVPHTPQPERPRLAPRIV